MDKKYTLQIDKLSQEELRLLLEKMREIFDDESHWDVQAYDSNDEMIVIMTPSEKEKEMPTLTVVPDDETTH